MIKNNITILILGACLVLLKPAIPEAVENEKYSKIIWGYLETLCGFGPRYSGSEGYLEALKLIRRVGNKYADRVVEQPFQVQVSEGKNLRMTNLELQFAGTQGGAPIIIGGHFDTRPFADQETHPEKRTKPIIGANDGGSNYGSFVSFGALSFSTPGSSACSSGVF